MFNHVGKGGFRAVSPVFGIGASPGVRWRFQAGVQVASAQSPCCQPRCQVAFFGSTVFVLSAQSLALASGVALPCCHPSLRSDHLFFTAFLGCLFLGFIFGVPFPLDSLSMQSSTCLNLSSLCGHCIPGHLSSLCGFGVLNRVPVIVPFRAVRSIGVPPPVKCGASGLSPQSPL